MRRVWFWLIFLAFMFIPLISADLPGTTRDPYEAAAAAKQANAVFDAIQKFPRGIHVQASALPALEPPVLSLAYYSGSFDGYVADAFDLRQNQGPYVEVDGPMDSYPQNDLTALLKSKTKPAPVRWPYLYGFVTSRAASYRYGIVAVSTDSAKPDLTALVEPQLLYLTNRIPLDVSTNGQIFTPTYSAGSIFTGGTTGYAQVAQIATPLPPFGGQFPSFLKTVQTTHYGFYNAKGEFKINQQSFDSYYQGHVADGRSVYAAVVYDATDPQDVKPLCHVAFEKIQTSKQTFVQILSDADTPARPFNALQSQVGPSCTIRKLQSAELANYLKAAEVIRRGKPFSFVPGNCADGVAHSASCRPDRFFTYQLTSNPSDGGFTVVATDVQNNQPYLAQLLSSGSSASAVPAKGA